MVLQKKFQLTAILLLPFAFIFLWLGQRETNHVWPLNLMIITWKCLCYPPPPHLYNFWYLKLRRVPSLCDKPSRSHSHKINSAYLCFRMPWVLSLLKSKSGLFNPNKDILFLYFSFLFSKNGLLIQMIHNGGGFFGSYRKPNTLNTWSEAFLYCGSEKNEHCQW